MQRCDSSVDTFTLANNSLAERRHKSRSSRGPGEPAGTGDHITNGTQAKPKIAHEMQFQARQIAQKMSTSQERQISSNLAEHYTSMARQISLKLAEASATNVEKRVTWENFLKEKENKKRTLGYPLCPPFWGFLHLSLSSNPHTSHPNPATTTSHKLQNQG